MKFRALPLMLLVLAACKNSRQEDESPVEYFPVRSYLQSQVKHIDTSLYSLRLIVKEGSRNDTTFIPREQFRKQAADFLAIPDIASSRLKDEYTESRIYDDVLKRVIFSYTPKEEDASILRQDVTILPDAGGEDAVKTIFINQLDEDGEGSIQKKMLWEVNRRFQVVTTVSRPGQPDASRTLEVWWGPFPSAE